MPALTMQQLFVILRRRRLIVLSASMLFVCAGVMLCVLSTREYRSVGRIEITRQNQAELNLDEIKGEDNNTSNALEDNISIQTQAAILHSDTLALKVIQDLGLETTADFSTEGGVVARLMARMRPPIPTTSGDRDLENAPSRRTHVLGVFQRHLQVKPLGGTRLIEVSYSSSSPQTAAAVVNELTKDLLDYSFQKHFNATSEAAHWLASQMDELKAQAEERQAKVVQLQREAGVYSIGAVDATGKELAYSATLDRLQQATQALGQATSNRILKGSIYEMVRRAGPDSISGLSGSTLSGFAPDLNNSFGLLQTLRGQQAALQTEFTGDASKYGSDHPKLRDEKAALSSINAAINDEIKRIGERAANDYQTAVSAETRLRADYQRERTAADRLNDKAIEYSIAKQEATESRQLYQTLYQHLKEAGVVEGLRSSNVTVIDPGRVPSSPSQPKVGMILGIALFAGLIFGTVGAYIRDSIDTRIQSIDEMERCLSTPLLCVIPRAAPLEPKRQHTLFRLKRPWPHEQLLSIVTPDSPLPAPDATPSDFSESLRSLRTALLLSRSGGPPKIILVTSACEGEGKTTVSLHLAAALARNQSKVLFLEADLRCPKLSDRLSLPSDKGLSTLLTWSSQHVVARPFRDLPSLAMIPAGPIPPYPAELLGSAKMAALLERWSHEFDFIVLDTPSTLAVTDASVLAPYTDIVVLVARHAVSTRKSVQRAFSQLSANPKVKVAVILNGVNRNSDDYSDYFGYHGTPYYRREDKV